MKFVLCILAATLMVAMAAPLAENEYEMLFSRFVNQHSKKYETADEFFKRYNIFKTNLNTIMQHESNPARTFSMKMNKFGDLTNEEFRAQYTGRYVNLRHLRSNLPANVTTVPASVNWVTAGKVTPVKNQGQCGSCWSFSTTGCVESVHAIASGQLVSLSEQQLVDCSGSYGNQGCNGGEMQQAFQYIQANGGLCTEAAYPYTAQDGTCQTTCQKVVTISGYNNVQQNSEKALQEAAAKNPVSVAVEADGSNWQFYNGGVVTGSCGTNLDHGVLVAGYGTENGVAYWLVKNSWGADWGENGYIKLQRNIATPEGMCGIAMDGSYALA